MGQSAGRTGPASRSRPPPCRPIWRASARAPDWRELCGKRCRPDGSARTPGCPRRARWPSTSASPATPWPRPTPSSSPRAGWRRGSGPAPGSRQQARVAVEAKAVVLTDDRPPRFDLRTGTPDLSLFPRSAWGAALRRAVIQAPTEALGNGDPRGRLELRTSLSTYLSRARGVRVTPERVVVCTGFTQSLGLLAQVTADRGAHLDGHRAVRPRRLPRRHRAGRDCRSRTSTSTGSAPGSMR